MPPGPQLHVLNWLLAALPVLLLIGAIMRLRWSAPRAGGVAWLAAAVIALTVFGGSARTTAIASAKGLSLAFFVLSILWASVYMFNLIERLRGIEAIGRGTARLAADPLVQALLIGWGFSSFIQGVTGFGVPVAVAAPLLILVGFAPLRAAAMTLVGHGWAVTFGSLGSSYYTIQLVTKIPGDVIGPHMALLFALPTIASGAMVAHIEGGWPSVRRSAPLVLVVGAAMGAAMWVLAAAGAPQVATVVPGMVCLAGVGLLGRRPFLFGPAARIPAPATGAPAAQGGAVAPRHGQTGRAPGRPPQASNPPAAPLARTPRPMTFVLGFLPYILLIALSIVAQLGPVKRAFDGLAWGLDYPALHTAQGFSVAAAKGYAKIRLFSHPAPLIVLSVVIAAFVYRLSGRWRRGVGWESLRLTYGQSLTTTLGVGTMVMMAVVMADSGMTTLLAKGIAKASGPVFPVVSPFIGLLGAFLTGSNTNSNVMFGILQVETARELGIGAVTIASVQSIGGSFGSTLAPAKVLVAATFVGLSGKETDIWRIITGYVLLLTLLAGLQALILIRLIPAWAR